MLQNFHTTNKLEGGYLMFCTVLVQTKQSTYGLSGDQYFNEGIHFLCVCVFLFFFPLM